MRSRTSRAPLLCCGGPLAVGSTGPSKGASWPGKFWVRPFRQRVDSYYHWKILSPAAKRSAVDMLVYTMSLNRPGFLAAPMLATSPGGVPILDCSRPPRIHPV